MARHGRTDDKRDSGHEGFFDMDRSTLLLVTRRAPSSREWLWYLPYMAVGLFALAMLALVWGLQKREIDLERNALARDVQWAEQTMRLHLQANQEFLVQLARDFAQGALTATQFQARIRQHVAGNPELSSVAWVDYDEKILWAAPFDTADWMSGERLNANQALGFINAREAARPTYGEPYVDDRGKKLLEIYVPLFDGRQHVGAMVGVYSIEGMLRHLVPTWFTEKYQLSMVIGEDKVLASSSAMRPMADAIAYVIPIEPIGHDLKLRTVGYRTTSQLSRLVPAVLIVGLSLVIVGSLWALRMHLRRRVQVEKERDRLFNLSLDILCIVGLDGTFRRINPAFERILGYPPDDLAGTPLLELVHPEDVTATVGHLRALSAGVPGTFENRVRAADGRYRWLAWSANPVPEERLIYAVAHDVTQRRANEEALRAETSFRKAMDESLVSGLRAIDMDGRIIYANAAFCRMTGFSQAELVGTAPPFPYWPPEDLDVCERNLALTLSGHIPSGGFETRVMRKDGERFHARFYVSPLIDSEGRQTGWMASVNDITEPRRARAALEASQERFIAVLDGLDAAVFVADANTDEVLFANRTFKAIYGFDVVRRSAEEVAPGLSPQRTQYAVDPRVLTADDLPRELFDGEVQNPLSGRWYHLRERATRWVDGRVVHMAIATDITDRKLIEEVNLQQQQRLQQTSRLITMGEMASSLAHELNQPLSAIANYNMGCVNRLQSGEYRVEDILAAMQKSSHQAERAGKIIRRVREFVRKSEPQRAPCRLAEIVEDAVGFAEIDARKAGVSITIDVPRELPPLFVDRIMVEQVVLNLVKNGIEAMQGFAADRRELDVEAHVADDRHVELSVSDRGHGLPADAGNKLFVPFYTTKTQGMGMGLNICRSIVEYHDGRLWAEDRPGGGSTFRLTLPIHLEE